MYASMQSVLSAAPKVRRGRGRPRGDAARATRLRHIAVAFEVLVLRHPTRDVAARHFVAARTVRHWVLAAAGYPDPEARFLLTWEQFA